ncbi:hypothetical protein [Periweissella ghanensis]|uniref:Nudix hydrolase domain-containing protein n=1 Tax=Periweissella ghanensis TaxID=467997 RepID=A0ABM8ZA21_9LACO|nr:hypothetical protein [Periweissella ghanensis]MCM0601209.1 hypothetical protein [Periweissella ghanensis]CAH0418009.1 hypothetical protein WGH24286_00425 [Periweissella ghanensis]
MKAAMAWELKEELGLTIDANSLGFALMMHKRYSDTNVPYFNGYFTVENYLGTPKIVEPEKNAELIWVDVNELPDNLISYVEDGWK